jgi:hypothetical protein
MRIWQAIMEWQRVLNTGHWNFLHETPNRLWKILRYRSFAPLDFCTYCVELLICYMSPPIFLLATGRNGPTKKWSPHGNCDRCNQLDEWTNIPTVYHHAMNFPHDSASLPAQDFSFMRELPDAMALYFEKDVDH